MKKILTLSICALLGLSALAQQSADETSTYAGKVTIDLAGGGDITGGGQEANVEIIPTGDNTCTFRLPNFALDLGKGPMPLGDIVVPGVEVTEANGVKSYKGKAVDMKLLGEAIVADVNITGDINAADKANMSINVTWKMDGESLPIFVEFIGVNVQLPNLGFENWKTECGSSEAFGTGGYKNSPKTGEFRVRPGVEPQAWNGSNVNQQVSMEKKEPNLVKAADYKGGKAVNLKNVYIGVNLGFWKIGSTAPGFITFGTPWVYAETTVKNCDGGTYGGAEFMARPDELQLDINRVDTNNEKSSIIAYFWKGEFKSKVGKNGAPTEVRSDVDRAVMGTVASEEGSTGKLLASINESITTTNGEWQTLTYPIEWNGDEMPEKMNVVVCSGNYWDRSALQENTEVLVDNVKFIYHSRLNSLTIDGKVVALEEEKYDYNLDFALPEKEEAFVHEVKGKTAKSTVTLDAENSKATIKVSNVHADHDGKKEHIYNFSFATTPTGIEDIEASEAAVEYYNLQGIRVANPENGIYIRRQGNKVTKVYVK